MISLAAVAQRHLDDLERHYLAKERVEAVRNLRAALYDVSVVISRHPIAGIAAPAPYRHLAKPGRLWVKAGRYWFAYVATPKPTIIGVFFEAADIPRRL